MAIQIAPLGRIRGLSIDKLWVRSRQQFAILSDRLLRYRAPEMSDKELLCELNPACRGGSSADALRYRIRAKSRRFLPALGQRRAIVEMMNRRFPAERDAIIKTAEAALAGKFSLLGHDNLSFGDPPPSPNDWRLHP